MIDTGRRAAACMAIRTQNNAQDIALAVLKTKAAMYGAVGGMALVAVGRLLGI